MSTAITKRRSYTIWGMTTLMERIAAAMDAAKKTQADLVRETGQRSSSVFNWCSGKTKNLRGRNLVILARSLNVSESWLAAGVGPMKRSATQWPFALLDARKISALSSDDKIRLETAILITAHDFGLDVRADRPEDTQTGADS